VLRVLWYIYDGQHRLIYVGSAAHGAVFVDFIIRVRSLFLLSYLISLCFKIEVSYHERGARLSSEEYASIAFVLFVIASQLLIAMGIATEHYCCVRMSFYCRLK